MLCYTNHPKCDNKTLIIIHFGKCVGVQMCEFAKVLFLCHTRRAKKLSRAELDIALAGSNPVRIITFTTCKDLRKQTTLSPYEGRDCVCTLSACGNNSHCL